MLPLFTVVFASLQPEAEGLEGKGDHPEMSQPLLQDLPGQTPQPQPGSADPDSTIATEKMETEDTEQVGGVTSRLPSEAAEIDRTFILAFNIIVYRNKIIQHNVLSS